jgi:hypothetical protein
MIILSIDSSKRDILSLIIYSYGHRPPLFLQRGADKDEIIPFQQCGDARALAAYNREKVYINQVVIPLFLIFEPGHHLAQFGAHFFDQVFRFHSL